MERVLQPPAQVHKEVEDNLNFYTENDTNLIYEAEFFDEFVLVRPATPMFYAAVRQLSWAEFGHEFHEYFGDHQNLRNHIDGMFNEKQEVMLAGD